MISYTWGNSVNDIVSVLNTYCKKNKKDPKRLYIWICCLCNNQHRVVEDRKNGKDIPFEEFREVFGSKIERIGEVIALFSPWDDVLYLKRVWCIYELYTASTSDSCTLTIEMPQSTKDNLKEFLMISNDGNAVANKIFEVLGNTSIEDAKASVQSDKENILKLVREGDGGCAALDIKVNESDNKSKRPFYMLIMLNSP